MEPCQGEGVPGEMVFVEVTLRTSPLHLTEVDILSLIQPLRPVYKGVDWPLRPAIPVNKAR